MHRSVWAPLHPSAADVLCCLCSPMLVQREPLGIARLMRLSPLLIDEVASQVLMVYYHCPATATIRKHYDDPEDSVGDEQQRLP